MGTNYYRMKTISKEDREKLHKKLDEVLDVRGGDYILTEELEEIKNKSEVHICKSSCGWQVNFDHNWESIISRTENHFMYITNIILIIIFRGNMATVL